VKDELKVEETDRELHPRLLKLTVVGIERWRRNTSGKRSKHKS
jgi:hypothetical protein